MNITTIRSFDNYFLANITLTKLEGYGIECYLKDEFTITMNPIWGNAMGGIKLAVKEEDVEKADGLLKQFDEEYVNSIVCPRCGKSEITQISSPSTTNFITAILTWSFSNYAIAPQSIYQCGNCKYETETLPDTINESELHL